MLSRCCNVGSYGQNFMLTMKPATTLFRPLTIKGSISNIRPMNKYELIEGSHISINVWQESFVAIMKASAENPIEHAACIPLYDKRCKTLFSFQSIINEESE